MGLDLQLPLELWYNVFLWCNIETNFALSLTCTSFASLICEQLCKIRPILEELSNYAWTMRKKSYLFDYQASKKFLKYATLIRWLGLERQHHKFIFDISLKNDEPSLLNWPPINAKSSGLCQDIPLTIVVLASTVEKVYDTVDGVASIILAGEIQNYASTHEFHYFRKEKVDIETIGYYLISKTTTCATSDKDFVNLEYPLPHQAKLRILFPKELNHPTTPFDRTERSLLVGYKTYIDNYPASFDIMQLMNNLDLLIGFPTLSLNLVTPESIQWLILPCDHGFTFHELSRLLQRMRCQDQALYAACSISVNQHRGIVIYSGLLTSDIIQFDYHLFDKEEFKRVTSVALNYQKKYCRWKHRHFWDNIFKKTF